MLYAIISVDVANSLPLRASARPQHIKRLQQLRDKGQLILAGPHPAIDCDDPGPNGYTGSLVVAEFDSMSMAQEWANADPYVAAGVYASVEVKPFKYVLP